MDEDALLVIAGQVLAAAAAPRPRRMAERRANRS